MRGFTPFGLKELFYMRKSRRYRGGRPGGIGFLIPALIVLCIIAAGALYVINDNMTFTKDGSFFLPEKEKKSAENIETGLVIEKEDPEVEVKEPEVTDGKTENTDEKSLFVPIGAVKSTELFAAEIEKARTLGAKKLVLEVKAEDGTLAFSTKTKMGLSTGLAGDSEVLRANVQKAREEGFSVALFVSCFKDNEAAKKNQEYSVRTGNKIIWLDGENVRWLSPYSESAKGYLVDISKELVEFSPDEIVFSNISFPIKGKTEIVVYEDGGVSKKDALSTFMASLKENLSGIKLSAVYENYGDAYIKKSGQTAKIFDDAFDTVYINRDGGKYTDGYDVVSDLFKNPVPIETTPSSEKFMIRQ